MYVTLINVHLKQLAQQGKSKTFIYVMLGLLACAVFSLSFLFFKLSTSFVQVAAFCFGLILIVLSVHVTRADRHFVYHHIPHPELNFFNVYVFFTAPVLFGLLLSKFWWLVFVVFLCFGLMSSIKFQSVNRTRFLFISKLIPASNFEWVGGWRKQFVPLLLLYLLALSLVWIRILPLVLLWFITTTMMSFYNDAESINVLKANYTSAKKFLYAKFKNHAFLMLVLYLPVTILNAILNDGFVLINMVFLLLQVIMLWFAIACKYANYQPGTNHQGSIITAIVAFGGIVPFMIPVPAVMAINYYFKALENLQTYFND